jgi:signal transduction histidine kinase
LLATKLPDISGYEICNRLKNDTCTKEIPIIFIKPDDLDNELYCFDIGGADYINKPFQIKEVLARVKTHIQLKQLVNQFENHIFEQNRKAESIQQEIIELTELNASKDKFFSIMAHDLRSPFNGFLFLTELMETRDIKKEEIKEFGRKMHKSARNLFNLLENLLTWARVQRTTIEFKPEIHLLSNIVSQNINIFSENANQKNIEMVIQVPEQMNIFVDLPMINTVFRNFISNAIKFTRKGGKVIISAEEKENEILICVKDFGIGMTSEKKGKLFKLEERVSKSGTEGENGTGLGLLLCKEFVEKHKGKIWVESILGIGSSFYFSLPKITSYDIFFPSI